MGTRIAGITAPARTNLAVLKPFRPSTIGPDPMLFTRWVAGLPAWTPVALFLLAAAWPVVAHAQGRYGYADATEALWRWLPFLVWSGFFFNVLISVLAMGIGTLAGAALGLAQISKVRLIQRTAWCVTQLFRNSPWLVILFIVLLAFPFEVVIFGVIIPIPDWIKAVIGLSLPVMANISEIVRGAVNSVPTAQWEASESLAFSRRQTLWQIILPQCYKRMIPPWMNWYAILTMATPLISIVGVNDAMTLTQDALAAEQRTDLLMPMYGLLLLFFFIYCYPIARWTIRLERKFAVRI
jgi:polar amino acid transport system permease protein